MVLESLARRHVGSGSLPGVMPEVPSVGVPVHAVAVEVAAVLAPVLAVLAQRPLILPQLLVVSGLQILQNLSLILVNLVLVLREIPLVLVDLVLVLAQIADVSANFPGRRMIAWAHGAWRGGRRRAGGAARGVFRMHSTPPEHPEPDQEHRPHCEPLRVSHLRLLCFPFRCQAPFGN